MFSKHTIRVSRLTIRVSSRTIMFSRPTIPPKNICLTKLRDEISRAVTPHYDYCPCFNFSKIARPHAVNAFSKSVVASASRRAKIASSSRSIACGRTLSSGIHSLSVSTSVDVSEGARVDSVDSESSTSIGIALSSAKKDATNSVYSASNSAMLSIAGRPEKVPGEC